MGGVDKASLEVGGRTLLERVRSALTGAGAAQVVVVGPEQSGGPVAAVAAGLARVTAAVVVVLPADLPFVTATAVAELLGALVPEVHLAIPVDAGGRDQMLCAAWRTAALRGIVAALGDPDGVPAGRLVDSAGAVARLHSPQQPSPWFDCDTEEELVRARRWAQDGGL